MNDYMKELDELKHLEGKTHRLLKDNALHRLGRLPKTGGHELWFVSATWECRDDSSGAYIVDPDGGKIPARDAARELRQAAIRALERYVQAAHAA